MNKGYWQNFYKTNGIKEPTKFAQWCDSQIPPNSKILDLGSGNGRDSYFFAKKGHEVTGIDYATRPQDCLRVKFVQMNIMSFLERTQENYDVFYSRFFLHAIERSLIRRVIKHSKGLFIAEARSILDVSFVKDHKRNLINSDRLIKELTLNNFSIRYLQENTGLAIYKGQDPIIVRVIAKHNDKRTK